MEEKTMNIEEARQAIAAEMEQRRTALWREIREACQKYRGDIVARPYLTDDGRIAVRIDTVVRE